MEWLNKLDNILDRALSPSSQQQQHQQQQIKEEEEDEDEREESVEEYFDDDEEQDDEYTSEDDDHYYDDSDNDDQEVSSSVEMNSKTSNNDSASRRRSTIPGDMHNNNSSDSTRGNSTRRLSNQVNKGASNNSFMTGKIKTSAEPSESSHNDKPMDVVYDEGWAFDDSEVDGEDDDGGVDVETDTDNAMLNPLKKPHTKSITIAVKNSFEASVEEWSLAVGKVVDSITGSSTPLTGTSSHQLQAAATSQSKSSSAPPNPQKGVSFGQTTSPHGGTDRTFGEMDNSWGSSDDVPGSISFDKVSPRSLQVWDDGRIEAFDPKMNCFGVVHVRILRAQRLPCPVGSRVQAVVSLPPWKGRVRSERTSAFIGSVARGVCVRWDPFSEAGLCSMVHSWSGDDTPVPSISISLVFTPVALMEFSICTLTLSCETLMRTPNVWKRVFCETKVPDKWTETRMQYTYTDRAPLIEIEAMFKPVHVGKDNSEVASVGGATTATPQEPSNNVIASPQLQKSTDTVVSSLELTPSTPHLLRVQSHWTPAVCCVCKNLMMGWRIGFRCEECRIDCCSDCQLQVDLQIPCGSELARDAVDKAIQNKLTVANILATVAPVDGSMFKDKDGTRRDKSIESPQPLQKLPSKSADETPSIGVLKMEFIRACIFSRPLPPETEPEDVERHVTTSTLRNGDYYVRVSWTGSKKTTRTRTIQNTSKPVFDSGEMRWDVPHYGMEYRIEVVDAITDNPVGVALLPAQTILQYQRDWIAEQSAIRFSAFPKRFTEKKRMVIELRSGMKAGFGLDFFHASRGLESSKGRSAAGEISGLLELSVCLEESLDQLFGLQPTECPLRPPDELHMQLFQLHLSRIGAIIEDIKKAADGYNYLVSWTNPSLTSLSMVIFVYVCVSFNAEYVASLPCFFLVVYLLYLAWIRNQGNLKNRFLRKEQDAYREAEKKVSVRCAVHRPVGKIEISITQGKNIRSKDLGLPGSVGCRVFFDPIRYLNDKKKATIVAIDSSAATVHDIGTTDYQFTQQPQWQKFFESEECKRLKYLLPDESVFFGSTPEETTSPQPSPRPPVLQFPVLQPFAARSKELDGAGRLLHSELEPWSSSPAAVVVEVRFQDILNALGFDDALGEVCIPISKFIENGEIRGWFRVMEVGSIIVSPVEEIPKEVDDRDREGAVSTKAIGPNEQHPLIYLQLKWIPPGKPEKVEETDRMASIVIQEELIRSTILAQKNKLDLVGSSIGAFNTVRGLRGNVQLIQNSLGAALDVIESIRNAFNFTDPYKSSLLLATATLAWFFLALVPTRFLILLGGLAQYGTTFMTRYGPSFFNEHDQQAHGKSGEISTLEIRIATWFLNAIRGLPTDEDLRRAYFWESKRVGERESEILSSRKRQSRLQRLWNAPWYATVQLMERVDETKKIHWETVFAIVQSRRFLWWRSPKDFDSGEEPIGRIFLSGHAGLASLSPLEFREIGQDELPLVVTIFGRGLQAQQRASLLMPSIAVKDSLEEAVLAASFKAE